MSLATLSIDLETRLAKMQEGFDKAVRVAEKSAAQIEDRYAKLAQSIRAVGAAAAAAFVTLEMGQFLRQTLDGIDALNDLADATGASVENLSALEDAAARTGTTLDTVGGAIVKLNQVLQGAREGSAAAVALERLGLSAAELRRQDPAVALQATAVALARFADDGNKARIVQELFGKSVREVAPLLKDLAESGELVATVTTQQAAEVDKFNKQLAALNKNATDVTRSFLGSLVPALNTLLERLAALDRFNLLNFGAATEVLKGNTFREPAEGAAFYAKQLENLQRQFANVASTEAGRQRTGLLGDLAGDIEKAERLRDFYRSFAQQGLPQADYSNEGRSVLRSLGDLPPPPPAPKRGGSAAGQQGGSPLDPVLRGALDLVDDTDLQRLGQLQLQLQGLFELGGDSPTPAIVEAMQKLGRAINDLTPGQREQRAAQARLDELTRGTPSAQREQVLSDIKLINQAYTDGAISATTWAEAQVANTARLPKELAVQLDELTAIQKQFQANVQNTLGDNIASALRGDFDSIADAWKNMLLDMVAQATAADLASRLFGKDGRGGAFADFTQFLGGFFATGGVFSQGQSITAFADGGVLNRPTFFGMSNNRLGVAGEAGPEAVLPLKRGSDGKLGVAGGGGGVTNNYYVAAGITRGELVSALQLMSQQTEARVMSNLAARRVI